METWRLGFYPDYGKAYVLETSSCCGLTALSTSLDPATHVMLEESRTQLISLDTSPRATAGQPPHLVAAEDKKTADR